ncbi:PKD domain-containing protein [Flavobacterium sp. ANB]|uniref:PKD domain-containing protein n=1 Tax=unclassified Flavobacterium TaxID=196869 RepID=UPI0012B72AA4|nr:MULTISPECIES: PKD domain-containing protein [unclassified Flavobacterium]MBF4517229.1 PKD domain-containing protein [Flavobacterium sp. ANB]MTD70606.1 PKD domain-containing protein [Flavobacterium sp. LC2016-13]
MKTIAKILLLLTVFFIINSCTEEQIIDSVTDCWGQSSKLEIQYSLDPLNSKRVNYVLKYDGSGSLSSIKWTFGDGKTETVNGLKVTHTYENVGSYEVKADITVTKDQEKCPVTESKTVQIN